MTKIYKFSRGFSESMMSGFDNDDIDKMLAKNGVTIVYSSDYSGTRYLTEGVYDSAFFKWKKENGELEEVESITDGNQTKDYEIRGYYALHPDLIDERGRPVEG